jgi:hypothetical protein
MEDAKRLYQAFVKVGPNLEVAELTEYKRKVNSIETDMFAYVNRRYTRSINASRLPFFAAVKRVNMYLDALIKSRELGDKERKAYLRTVSRQIQALPIVEVLDDVKPPALTAPVPMALPAPTSSVNTVIRNPITGDTTLEAETIESAAAAAPERRVRIPSQIRVRGETDEETLYRRAYAEEAREPRVPGEGVIMTPMLRRLRDRAIAARARRLGIDEDEAEVQLPGGEQEPQTRPVTPRAAAAAAAETPRATAAPAQRATSSQASASKVKGEGYSRVYHGEGMRQRLMARRHML